jgi:GDP-4-dehydro-6-deoxy-D-mannose reductase
MPRRILVTGAAGFVGAHLLPILASAFPSADIVPSQFDLRDPASLHAELRADPPDACVHLAAISAIPAAQSDPDAAWQVNLLGTLDLARGLLAETPGCTLLYVSTSDAYGLSFQRGMPLDETAPLAPMNTYGATKAAADLALGAMVADGLRVIRVRPFNHTGPGQSGVFVVAAFARQIARIAAGLQPPVLRVGALDPHRDFLDVRDVCAAYVRCVAQAPALPPGTIFNIASGTARRIGDVLDELLAIAGLDVRVEPEAARFRNAEIPTASGDATAAGRLLDWAPRIAWHTTLSDVLADWHARVATESG